MSFLYEKYKALILAAYRATLLGDAACLLTSPELTANMVMLPAGNLGEAEVESTLSIDANMVTLGTDLMEVEEEIHPDLSIVALMHLVNTLNLLQALAVEPDLQISSTMAVVPVIAMQALSIDEDVQLTAVMDILTVVPMEAEVETSLQIEATLSTPETTPLATSGSFEGATIIAELTPLEVLAMLAEGQMPGVEIEASLVSIDTDPMIASVALQVSIVATMNFARDAIVNDYFTGTIEANFYGRTLDQNSLWLTII